VKKCKKSYVRRNSAEIWRRGIECGRKKNLVSSYKEVMYF
jgi:ribosomal protein L37AE/L43A